MEYTGVCLSLLRGDSRNFLTSSNDIDRCGKYAYTESVIGDLVYIPWAGDYVPQLCSIFSLSSQSIIGFSALRVFALTSGNWFLALAVCILAIGPSIINFVQYPPFVAMNHNYSLSDRLPFNGLLQQMTRFTVLFKSYLCQTLSSLGAFCFSRTQDNTHITDIHIV